MKPFDTSNKLEIWSFPCILVSCTFKKYAYIEYVLKIRVAIKKGYEREHLKGQILAQKPTNERERERCGSVGKVAKWRPGGHGFNPYIPQWHLRYI